MSSMRAFTASCAGAVIPGRHSRTTTRPACVALPRKVAAARRSARADASATQEVVTSVTTSVAPTPVKHGVHQVSAADYQGFLEQHREKLVIFDFYTTWCGPCKMIAPELERMASEADGNQIVYAKLDCGADNDSKRLAMGLGIKALPTFHLYRDTKIVDSMTGAKVKSLQDLISKHM